MPDVMGRPSPGDAVFVEGDPRRWSVNHVGEIGGLNRSSLIVLVEVQEVTERTDPFTMWVNIDKIRQITGVQVDLEQVTAWLRAARPGGPDFNLDAFERAFERAFAREYKPPLITNDA